MPDTDSLKSKRIVVTRASHQAPPLEALIRELGAVPVAYPCIAIAPPADPSELDGCLRKINQFDWLLLTSSNTARALADRLAAQAIQPDWTSLKVAAVGLKTRAEIRLRLTTDADFIPTVFAADQLARQLPLNRFRRILLPQSDRATKTTAQILRSRGADVTTAIAYRTIIGSGGADLPAMVAQGDIDALTFMSPSAVAFFRERCRSEQPLRLPAVCSGRATADTARNHDFQLVINPMEATAESMMQALAAHFADS